ncbi:hypothetical protein JOF53_004884 [Crossiella equi]|uniref:Uncharacterized protein n=1 Tax=Crossiella equi TaxID=130796 RepID=A0ABS5AID7_9PSEU|nr:hypothetical protein [Crossiella equi]MBP2476012.1 hypothetical protein [Crossiella equi]
MTNPYDPGQGQPQYPQQGYPSSPQGFPQPGYGQPAYGQPGTGPQYAHPGYGHPGMGAPQYGAGGYLPPGMPGEGSALVRPKQVELSFWLWVAGAAISVVTSVLGYLASLEVAERVKDLVVGDAPPQVSSFVGTFTSTFALVVMILSLILAGMYLLFAVFLRNGRNWARITLAVLGGLAAIMIFPRVFSLLAINNYTVNEIAIEPTGMDVVVAVLGVLPPVLAIVAIVFMFQSAANRYFQQA